VISATEIATATLYLECGFNTNTLFRGMETDRCSDPEVKGLEWEVPGYHRDWQM